jgi:hypothetical protein
MTGEDLLEGTALARGWRRSVLRRARLLLAVQAPIALVLEWGRPARTTWSLALVHLWLAGLLLWPLLALGWPPRPTARRVADGFVLRYPAGWRYGLRTYFVVVVAVVMTGMSWRDAPTHPFVAAGAIAMFVGLLAFGLIAPRERYVVTRSHVERRPAWIGRVTQLPWADVRQVQVDGFLRLVLAGATAKLKVPLAFEGSGDFAAQVLATLPPPVIDAGTNVRPLLEAAAARRSRVDHGEEGTRSHSTFGAVATVAALLVLALAAWGSATRLDAPHASVATYGFILALYGALYVGLGAADAVTRQRSRRATTTGSSAPPSSPVVEVWAEPGALRRRGAVLWAWLLGGSLLFPATAILVEDKVRWDAPRLAPALLAALSVATVVASLMVPRLVRVGPNATAEATALTRLLAVLALREAAVLTATLAFLIAHDSAFLALASVGVMALAAGFPTPRRWRSLRTGPPTAAP